MFRRTLLALTLIGLAAAPLAAGDVHSTSAQQPCARSS